MNFKEKQLRNLDLIHTPLTVKNIISHKAVMKKFPKMQKKAGFLDLRFDPSGVLVINEFEQEKPDDFLMYLNGTMYAMIAGRYHCAGKIDMCCRLVAAISGKKFISQREDGTFFYSSRKVPLSKDCCLLLLFRHDEKFHLLIADGKTSNHIHILSVAESTTERNLLVKNFLTLLNQHDTRLVDLVQEWLTSQFELTFSAPNFTL